MTNTLLPGTAVTDAATAVQMVISDIRWLRNHYIWLNEYIITPHGVLRLLQQAAAAMI